MYWRVISASTGSSRASMRSSASTCAGADVAARAGESADEVERLLLEREQVADRQLADPARRVLRRAAGPTGAAPRRPADSTAAAARRRALRRAISGPPTVMRPTRIDPVRREPRRSTSRPMATMSRNMSRRLPAIVTSSTGCAISPSSTQKPAAPRE